LRLDALGERLTKTAGLKPQEFNFQQPPGQGGANPSKSQGDLSFGEVSEQLQQLASKVADRSDHLAVLEALLSREYQKEIRLPSAPPVMTEWHSSDFGVRIDPFTGKKSFHEGIDFSAEVGAPITAAAAGIVVYSDYHHDYGNMIEIDHGNGLVSRYAHASQRLVKLGDIVLKGQQIAKVGSTGHSTGPHLHFEVRFKGVAQNPARFLQAAN
jgi:murein DD-endopeptidase MepM/ murein hydrolase activator NlpD